MNYFSHLKSFLALSVIWLVKEQEGNPQKLTQLSSRSHPRHLVGNKTAQKDITIDHTIDSQVNSNFPYRWSPASLTFNNFFLPIILYITRITINNNAPHLKSPKNQNRRAVLGQPAIKITGGLQLVCDRPTLALSYNALNAQSIFVFGIYIRYFCIKCSYPWRHLCFNSPWLCYVVGYCFVFY